MTDQPTPIAKPKRIRPKSRPQRWADAVSKAEAAIAGLRSAADSVVDALGELRDMQEEYSEWKDNLPDNLQSSPVADKLDEIANLDIESVIDSMSSIADDAENIIGEAEGIDLPRGFGRD